MAEDTKDVEKVLSYYADDASLVILGEPVATGKDAIRKVIKNMVSDPNFTLMFGSNCIEVSKGGTSATAWEPTSCLRLTPLTSQPKRKNRPRVGAFLPAATPSELTKADTWLSRPSSGCRIGSARRPFSENDKGRGALKAHVPASFLY